MHIEDRRIGRFYVADSLIGSQDLRVVMAACVVVRCEWIYERHAFEYVALSPQFDPVPLNERAPLYDWILSHEPPLGFVSVSARRSPSDCSCHTP